MTGNRREERGRRGLSVDGRRWDRVGIVLAENSGWEVTASLRGRSEGGKWELIVGCGRMRDHGSC